MGLGLRATDTQKVLRDGDGWNILLVLVYSWESVPFALLSQCSDSLYYINHIYISSCVACKDFNHYYCTVLCLCNILYIHSTNQDAQMWIPQFQILVVVFSMSS